MNASEIMNAQPIYTCGRETSVQEVSQVMADNNIGAVPVLDDKGCLEGIITDRDLCCRAMAEGMDYDTPIEEVMTTEVQYVRPDSSLHEIESIMQQFKIRRLPVVDEEMRIAGFISTADLLHRCHSPREEHQLACVLDDICS